MSLKTKSVLIRFIKGALASAFALMATSLLSFAKEGQIETFAQVGVFLHSLAVSFSIGAVTGLVLAGDKYFNWKK